MPILCRVAVRGCQSWNKAGQKLLTITLFFNYVSKFRYGILMQFGVVIARQFVGKPYHPGEAIFIDRQTVIADYGNRPVNSLHHLGDRYIFLSFPHRCFRQAT